MQRVMATNEKVNYKLHKLKSLRITNIVEFLVKIIQNIDSKRII